MNNIVCAKCKTENPENATFCLNCGKRLKTICPKCKTENSTQSASCTNCNFRLIRPCPVCKTPNEYNAKECQKCNHILLKKCPECGMWNLSSFEHCKKCNATIGTPKPEKITTCMVIQLFNGDFLEKNIKKQELKDKILKKFFQIILTKIKPLNLKGLKLAPYTVGIDIQKINSLDTVILADELFNEFETVNEKLQKANLYYDIKLLISQSDAKKSKFGINLLEYSTSGSICVDRKTKDDLINDLEFEELECGIFKILGEKELTEEDSIQSSQLAPMLDNSYQEQLETFEEPKPEHIQEQTIQEQPAPTMIEEQEIEQQGQETQEEIVQQSEQDIQPQNIEQETTITQPETIDPPIEEEQQENQDVIQEENNTQNIEENKQEENYINEQEPQQILSERVKLKTFIDNILLNKEGGVITLLGDMGIGKKTIINNCLATIDAPNLCVLQADCHPTINHLPYASLQMLIRSMLSLPFINTSTEKIIDLVKKVLINTIQVENESTADTIANLLIPSNAGEDIDANKDRLLFAIKDLFNAIAQKHKLVIILKEPEFMDRGSLQIFESLFDKQFLSKAFVINLTSLGSSISAFFAAEHIAKNELIASVVAPYTLNETRQAFAEYITNPEELSDEFLELIHTKTQGSPLFTEELFTFFFQSGLVSSENNALRIKPEVNSITLPDTLEELEGVRLDLLFAKDPAIYQFLSIAVTLGYSFFPTVISKALQIEETTLVNILNLLISIGILVTQDNINFKFKNKKVYEIIQNTIIKDDEQEKQIAAVILQVLSEITDVNSYLVAHFAQKANNYSLAFTLYSLSLKEISSTGDIPAYFDAQKNILEYIDYSESENKEEKKLALQEKLGIENYQTEPQDAIKFLSRAIEHYEETKNNSKIIELCSYIVKSLTLLGNSQEAISYIDKAIEYINPNMKLQMSLMKFLKLKFLIESGYLGEVATIIQTDIMPNLQEIIQRNQELSDREYASIAETLMKSQLMLIKTLSLQGSKTYPSMVQSFMANEQNAPFEVDVTVIEAMHKALNGQIEQSMADVKKATKMLNMAYDPNKDTLLLELELVKVINKVFYSESNPSVDIAQLAQKSRVANNAFVYNFAQLLFINQMIKNKDYMNATQMVNDCLSYFAEQKLASFAIPSWMMLSLVQAHLENYDEAIQVVTQAMDVTIKPQIENYYYFALLKKLLSDYFFAKGELDLSKMHLEEAITFTKMNDLFFLQGKFYLDLAKLHQKINTSPTPPANPESVGNIINIAEQIANSCQSSYLLSQIEKFKNSLS